jgi:hypothetical protein
MTPKVPIERVAKRLYSRVASRVRRWALHLDVIIARFPSVGLQVLPNRYDGREAAKMMERANLMMDGPNPYIEVPLGDDDEFSMIFLASEGEVDEHLIDLARSLLMNVGELDNQVQEGCAADCRASGFHPRNFEGALAYMTVGNRYALLHYFGTGVNTEWDSFVERKGERWVHVGVATEDSLGRLCEIDEGDASASHRVNP